MRYLPFVTIALQVLILLLVLGIIKRQREVTENLLNLRKTDQQGLELQKEELDALAETVNTGLQELQRHTTSNLLHPETRE